MALLGAPLAFALLVGGGVAVRAQMKPPPEALPASAALKPAAKPAPRVATPVVAAKAEPAPAPKAEAPAKAPKAEAAPTPRKKSVAKSQPPTQVAAAKPETSAAAAVPATAPAPVVGAGVIQLAILPWGEVFVDGRSRGVSPPLRTIELPPGLHTVEVRNTSFPALTQRVEVRAGEPVRIRHRFR
jgi:serine/threonine-protein kinase